MYNQNMTLCQIGIYNQTVHISHNKNVLTLKWYEIYTE